MKARAILRSSVNIQYMEAEKQQHLIQHQMEYIAKKNIPPVGRQCPLCTWEKYFTIYRPKEATLNN